MATKREMIETEQLLMRQLEIIQEYYSLGSDAEVSIADMCVRVRNCDDNMLCVLTPDQMDALCAWWMDDSPLEETQEKHE